MEPQSHSKPSINSSVADLTKAQQKWVTFEDMVDDAMEGGKLSPMDMRSDALNVALQLPRRYSVTGNSDFRSFRNDLRSYTEPSIFSKSTSISSNSSCDSDSNSCSSYIKLDPPPSKECKMRRFMYNSEKIADFSQTFPGHSRNYSNAVANDKQQYSLTKAMKPEYNKESVEENLKETSDDKYMAIKNLNRNQEHGYTGWSTTVMGTGPFGWSNDLLNVCTPQTVSDSARKRSDSSLESNESFGDNQESYEKNQGMNEFKKSHNLSLPLKSTDIFLKPTFDGYYRKNIEIQEEPWYTAHNGLRYTSWDKSPNRTFLRNFP